MQYGDTLREQLYLCYSAHITCTSIVVQLQLQQLVVVHIIKSV
jgi:hypothetical protein